MNPSTRPRFRVLDSEECEAIVAKNHIGRIAYAQDRSIDILPVYYAFADGWIYGRMRRSRKKAMLGWYGWWPVAFQVDEVEDMFHWRTVVIQGGFYALPADGAPWEQKAREEAIDLLRGVIPQAFRKDDPMPAHSGIFRIAVQTIAGTEASPGDEPPT